MAQVAIVTGAARNLGAVIVSAMAEQGLDVVVNTRSSLDEAREVADRAERLGVRAVPVAADVTEPEAVSDMIARATSMGDLRVLVNNAALRTRAPVEALTLEDWRAVQSVILDGSYLCARAAVMAMRATGGGAIVNVLGGNAMAGDPDRVHVSAAKHGLFGLTLALAKACAADGITVNAVSPSGMTGDPAHMHERRRRVADVVAFLASPAAAAVSGQLVEIDCARTGGGP